MKKIKNNKKNTGRKNINLLAAAALTAALLGGQVYPAFAGSSNVSVESSSLIPENVTIDAPTELYNVGLPGSEYGTLSWADGSFVPSKRVQSCQVILTPSGSADLSGLEGYDKESGVVTGYVTVVVSSIEEAPADVPEDGQESGGITEAPSVTVTPDETVTPAGTVTPGVSDETKPDTDTGDKDQEKPGQEDTDQENKDQSSQGDGDKTEDEKIPGDAAPAEQIGTAEGTDGSNLDAENEENKPEDIFDRPVDELIEDSRPTTADETLTEEEKAARGEENHSCAGISVSGINLPWYVQFRATSGDSYQFTNQEDAAIFQSYEFELWDLQNDTEYIIPDGEYISVTVPVKEGYEYIIEHLLDNGATETIVPSVDGNTMIFSTHSFSPFGIAGSKPLVGSDIAENSYPDSQEQLGTSGVNAQQQSSLTATPSGSSGTNAATPAAAASDKDNESESSQNSSSRKAVNTGDTTNIYPFVILLAVAVIFVGVVVYLKKRK